MHARSLNYNEILTYFVLYVKKYFYSSSKSFARSSGAVTTNLFPLPLRGSTTEPRNPFLAFSPMEHSGSSNMNVVLSGEFISAHMARVTRSEISLGTFPGTASLPFSVMEKVNSGANGCPIFTSSPSPESILSALS